MDIAYLFFLFFIYSVIGYFSEITYCSIMEKKVIVNRGFCLGPYCPIYGVGAVLMIIFLKKYQSDPIILFFMASIICSLVEYITSFLLEKIFKARWWDYSNQHFNIEGRICLKNATLFGLGGILIFYVFNPILDFMIHKIPHSIFIGITIFFFFVFLIDVMITVFTLSRLKIAQANFKKKDATEEITKMIRLEIVKNKNLVWRLLKAFPNLSEEDQKNALYKIKVYLEKRYEKKKKFSFFHH